MDIEKEEEEEVGGEGAGEEREKKSNRINSIFPSLSSSISGCVLCWPSMRNCDAIRNIRRSITSIGTSIDVTAWSVGRPTELEHKSRGRLHPTPLCRAVTVKFCKSVCIRFGRPPNERDSLLSRCDHFKIQSILRREQRQHAAAGEFECVEENSIRLQSLSWEHIDFSSFSVFCCCRRRRCCCCCNGVNYIIEVSWCYWCCLLAWHGLTCATVVAVRSLSLSIAGSQIA